MYTIDLTPSELRTLGFMAYRGYFPIETYDGLMLRDKEESPLINTYELSEAAAWPLCDHIEAQDESGHSWFPCAPPELEAKLCELWEGIV